MLLVNWILFGEQLLEKEEDFKLVNCREWCVWLYQLYNKSNKNRTSSYGGTEASFCLLLLPATILDKINGTSRLPLLPFQWCQNGTSCSSHIWSSSLPWGKGVNCSILSLQDWNIGQNKWNIWTTSPPISMMPKWHVLLVCLRGGGNCSIYSIQDCSP